MKRFYCTICKKYKRVRRLPANIANPTAKQPSDRIGVCKWHDVSVIIAYDKLNRKVGA